MSTQEERDDVKFVNINRVAKAVKALAYFALHSENSDCNLLITKSFILNLTEDQFWKIQCKLEVKELGKWFMVHKGNLIEGDPIEPFEIEAYFDAVNNPDLEMIEQTRLNLDGIKLYAADGQYVGVNNVYVDMLGYAPALEQDLKYPESLVAAGVHVLPSIREIKSDYLAQLLLR